RGADREDAGTLPLEQPFRADADMVERLANDDQIVAPGGRELQALALAIEQPQSKRRLQRLDLLADRALGDVQLLRRASEALVASRGLERPKGMERRQPTRHHHNLIRETWPGDSHVQFPHACSFLKAWLCRHGRAWARPSTSLLQRATDSEAAQ